MNVIDKLVQKINKNEVENKVETLVLNFSFFFFKKKKNALLIPLLIFQEELI